MKPDWLKPKKAAQLPPISAGEQEKIDGMRIPSIFADKVLGLKLYPWQEEVIGWFVPQLGHAHGRVKGALVTPNGAGKSSVVIATLATWWMAMHLRAKVVITTKDAKQLEKQIWPALQMHIGKFAGWSYVTSPYITVRTPTGGMLAAFTTTEGARAEGWHKEDDLDGPLLMIVDEAKSVEEAIFLGFDRCTYNGLLYVSSPGLMMGSFYNAFTKNAASFKRRKVSLLECPNIDRARVDDIIATYGEKHWFTQSSVYGEFTDQDGASAFVFPLSVVNKNLYDPPRWQPERGRDRSAFCDFAAGGDENVLAIRKGNKVEIAETWRDRDTMSSVGRFAILFRKHDLQAGEICADEGGLGKPMIDALWRAGWEIGRVNNGARAWDRVYDDRGSEMWHECAAAVTRGECILPNDPELIAQLTTRMSRPTGEGKLGLEPKKEMAKRGLPSPDRADAVCGAWCCRGGTVGQARTPLEEWRDSEGFDDSESFEGALPGAWAG